MTATATIQAMSENDPRIQAALDELRELILHHFPDATFTVTRGDDPEAIYLTPIVDVEDLYDVVEVFIDRLVDLQVDEGLPIYVVPDQPLDRVMAQLRAKANGTRQPEVDTPEFLAALGLSDADEPLV